MKIAFIPGSCVPFHGKSLEFRPLGGIETATIRLAEALDTLGHDITVFSHFENPPLTKPIYLPVNALKDLDDIDVLIAVRDLMPLFLQVKAKRKFFWTGDSHEQLQHVGLGDKRVKDSIKALLAVSNWQADKLCEVSGFPKEKARILRNGITLSNFQNQEPRAPKRLIYSSTPYRGLQHLARYMPQLLKLHPEIELHVFSGMKVYENGSNDLDGPYRALYEQLSRIPNTTIHGNVLQDQLAKAFTQATILAYPNTFEESSCITALEAMAGGCVPVTSARAALPETIGDAGILIPGEPGTPQYDKIFIDSIDKLLSDSGTLNEYRQRGLTRSKGSDWNIIAKDFLEFLTSTQD